MARKYPQILQWNDQKEFSLPSFSFILNRHSDGKISVIQIPQPFSNPLHMSTVTNISIFILASIFECFRTVYFAVLFYKYRNWYIWLNRRMEWKIRAWSVHFLSPLILLLSNNFSQQGVWLGLKRQRALEQLESVIRYVSYPPSVFSECFPG